jgi:ABC-2 type transport system ATP-binding protein
VTDGTTSEPASVPDPLIEVAGLVKRYGPRTVLDGIDLAVNRGELVALLGPNGAGKTTTVEIIEGYRTADGGAVQVLGHEPRGAGPDLRARVGFMLQGGEGLQPRATAHESLRLYVALHDGDRTADELVRLTGLDAVANRPIRRLSGGERQRLALAIALAGDPEVLILDEPTAGLDPEARRSARGLIARLRDEGRAILLTTHDLADAQELADRVVILAGGHVVADASPAALMAGAAATAIRVRLHAHPEDDALARLGDALATIAGRGSTEGGIVTIVDGLTHQLAIGPGVQAADAIAAVAGWAAREGLLILELRSGSASLEERYLELTGDRDVEDSA